MGPEFCEYFSAALAMWQEMKKKHKIAEAEGHTTQEYSEDGTKAM